MLRRNIINETLTMSLCIKRSARDKMSYHFKEAIHGLWPNKRLRDMPG